MVQNRVQLLKYFEKNKWAMTLGRVTKLGQAKFGFPALFLVGLLFLGIVHLFGVAAIPRGVFGAG